MSYPKSGGEFEQKDMKSAKKMNFKPEPDSWADDGMTMTMIRLAHNFLTFVSFCSNSIFSSGLIEV
jgi:hypothetical protein